MSSTSKRWYQLSMLQLLVAMAVVAVMCWLNYRTTSWNEDLSDNLGLNVVEVKAGWPFTYRTTKLIVLGGSKNTKPHEVGKPTYMMRALYGDILVGLMVSVACVSVIGFFKRRDVPCPSPST